MMKKVGEENIFVKFFAKKSSHKIPRKKFFEKKLLIFLLKEKGLKMSYKI